MWKVLAGAVVGYWLGEQAGERQASTSAAPRSGASGWLGAFLILIAILAWGHVKIGPAPDACDAHCHMVLKDRPARGRSLVEGRR